MAGRSLKLGCTALGVLMALGLAGANASTPVRLTGSTDGVQPKDLGVLKKILRTAQVKQAEISSVERTTKHQARVMFDLARKDLQAAKDLYCSAGDAVLDRFEADQPRAKVLARMEKELVRQLPEARKIGCLNHVENPEVYAVDIAKSSVPDQATSALIQAGKRAVKQGLVVRFLYPPRDKRAFHFEFKRTRKR